MVHFPPEINLHFSLVYSPPSPNLGEGGNTTIGCKCLQISEPCPKLHGFSPQSDLKNRCHCTRRVNLRHLWAILAVRRFRQTPVCDKNAAVIAMTLKLR